MLKQALYENRQQRFTLLLLALYSAVVFMFDANESNIKFIYLAFGLIVLNMFIKANGIKIYKEAYYYIGYLAFGIVSVVWSADRGLSLLRDRGFFLLLVFLILATTYFVKVEKCLDIVAVLIVGAVCLSIYMFSVYGVSEILSAITTSEDARLGDLINNVNAVANSLVVGVIAIVGVAAYYKKWLALLLLLPIAPCFLAAGSRTATISLIVGVLTLILCLMGSAEKSSDKLVKLIIIFIVIFVVWQFISTIPATKNLTSRIENAFSVITGNGSNSKEVSAQTRLDYIDLGWKQFLKSPIIGNGMGCAGYAIKEEYNYYTYLHNNYMEILASGGILGFILYYAPYLIVFVKLAKRIFSFKENNPVIFISFALLVTKLVGHMGTVVYYSKIEFMLMALWISVINIPGEKDGKKLKK